MNRYFFYTSMRITSISRKTPLPTFSYNLIIVETRQVLYENRPKSTNSSENSFEPAETVSAGINAFVFARLTR